MMAAPSAFGQAGKRVRRIALAFNGTPESAKPFLDAFVQGMGKLGYAQGRDYSLDVEYAQGRPETIPKVVGDLLRRDPEVLVLGGSTAVKVAKMATSTVPIDADFAAPVELGLISSLARPGGNVTGVTNLSHTVGPKRLELLREILPGARRVAYLANPETLNFSAEWKTVESAARQLRMDLVRLDASGAERIDTVLAELPARRVDALVVGSAFLFLTYRRKIVDFCASHRIPAIHSYVEAVADGALAGYSASATESQRKLATYVLRILNGAKPADLPVEQPTKIELHINLKTAKALGIRIPQLVLLRADRVIE